jgi:diacylglycerol kinase (ATP)
MPSDDLLRSAWIILNPKARQGRRSDSLRRIRLAGERLGARWTIRPSRRPGEVEGLAFEAAQAGAKLVLAAGGDGTVHETVNGLMRAESDRRPAFSVIPLGSGNDLAKVLGIPKGLEPALEALQAGRLGAIDVAGVEPVEPASAAQRWFINDLGVGMAAETTRIYHALPRLIVGSARYIASALAVIARGPLVRVDIHVDGRRRHRGPLSMAVVSNGRWSGGRFLLNPHGLIDDGRLDVCLVGPLSRSRIAASLPRLMRGRHLSLQGVESCQAREIRIESDDLSVYQLDGELFPFPSGGLKIAVCPLALRALFGPAAPEIRCSPTNDKIR